MHLRGQWLVPVAILAMGCGHTEPFQDPDYRESGPFRAGPPLRLTYNAEPDLEPAFLPGDSLVAYRFGTPNQVDDCLGVLPAGGGTRISQSCPRTESSLDSIETYGLPQALGPDSVLLLRTTRRRGTLPDYGYLGIAPWRSATEFTPLRQFPFTTTTGSLEFTPSHAAVIAPGQAAYLATRPASACGGTQPTCGQATSVIYGLEIARLDLTTGSVTVVPGTSLATSVAAGRTSGAIIFTLPFDSRVFEINADGVLETLHDFGGDVTARDAMLVGQRLLAVTGGVVDRYTLPDSSAIQEAEGGDIVMADLALGTSGMVAPGAWSRPALSGDAGRIVAESANGDLYILDLP